MRNSMSFKVKATLQILYDTRQNSHSLTLWVVILQSVIRSGNRTLNPGRVLQPYSPWST